MGQTLQYDEVREVRLQLFYQRQTTSLMRKEAAARTVDEALSLAQDVRLPRLSVEFRLADDAEYLPGRWRLASGLGAAFENYVARLQEMEKIRFANSVIRGLTSAYHEAFDAVVEAAEALANLGWPVNWQQNIQTILEPTEYGLRDGKLVDRFSGLPERVMMGEELLLLGTVTYHRQSRSADDLASSFKPQTLTATNRALHEGIELHLRGDDDDLPAQFRYCSNWMPGKSGTSYRIAI
ncbi:hypothetical protein GGQ64_004995 [Rhizobium azooxidifex]|uniref:Uncharacterized protein n=1 Tax=Mycoplana azooxidifex TaxID=1636188 RepID=A0A7W6DAS4_9HYPH|nr:hypothetical protein [Mycoplana azooxidifex]MBB3979750.1 hypothetical protein [Mycoplana azooxidifex]